MCRQNPFRLSEVLLTRAGTVTRAWRTNSERQNRSLVVAKQSEWIERSREPASVFVRLTPIAAKRPNAIDLARSSAL